MNSPEFIDKLCAWIDQAKKDCRPFEDIDFKLDLPRANSKTLLAMGRDLQERGYHLEAAHVIDLAKSAQYNEASQGLAGAFGRYIAECGTAN